ncbi:MAG: glycoside hydrolase family 3 N-terminal domain-containing protein [Ferruginibacter sp.]
MNRIFFLIICLWLFSLTASAQKQQAAGAWADSVLSTLSGEEKIAQLMVLRLSSYDFKTKTPIYYDSLVAEQVKKYNVGGICLFQGNPVKLGTVVNQLQSLAKTPIMVCIDGEWGVGMRLFDSVQALPHQMMLGAVQDSSIIYRYGKLVGAQCRRLGINVNYAPVVDINNNPNNPVINDRSFGEDKYKVALYGIQYMRGMQEEGVMACAKHFPGHGDVAVDSHLDLPIINKSIQQLDSLELYPFKAIFNAGVGSVMIAHLYIPAIDSARNRATSISKNNVTGLMRNQLNYQGLTFTDALEMQGVKKFYPDGEASVESLVAGNDMLCLPGDVEQNIKKIKEAIAAGRLSWNDIELHCKKVLVAKYMYSVPPVVNTENITADLNKGISEMKKTVAENAITLLDKTSRDFFPLSELDPAVAYVGIGLTGENAFAKRMKADYNAAAFYFNYKEDAGRVASIVELVKRKYKRVVIGIHAYSRTPANNFGMSAAALQLIKQLQRQTNSISFVFGNPYAIKNFCNAKNLVACYEDDSLTQRAAVDFLQGKFAARGKLPVTVCDTYKFGSGIVMINANQFHEVDDVAENAVKMGATPGCEIMVVKDGKIAYNKAYGWFDYSQSQEVTAEAVYDMASVTKMCATTIAIMRLYDEGRISLDKKLGDYLPLVKGTNKAQLIIKNILLHQAGLAAFIPFYKETYDTATGKPYTRLYAAVKSDSFAVKVADSLYLRNDWNDTMLSRIIQSPLGPANKYVYSDNDFIFLAKVVEAVSGTTLDKFVKKEFYTPMSLATAGFRPRDYVSLNKIAPTENEPFFRRQLIQGYVHDPGAAMFGGVAGHAGLFSNSYDIACIMQMLLNGGVYNGKRYLQKETVDLFTAYHSNISRRGFGFDKPEKDNDKRPEPYPCYSASPATFGHTGFTGTCAWADPVNNLIFVFLSNRVSPDGTNTKLLKMNVRPAIHEAIYRAFGIAKK